MALHLHIKSILCAEQAYGVEPPAADDCALFLEVEIGQVEAAETEVFSFTAITPKALQRYREVRWGRGMLLLPVFSWAEIDRVLARLLASVEADSWTEVVVELRKFMDWEFDNYPPASGH